MSERRDEGGQSDAARSGLQATSGDGDPPGGTGRSDELAGSNLQKDPDEWKTGDEPMTGAQASYLKTLSDEAKEPFDDQLTKSEASKRIDELQAKTGRGQS